jgi:putative oxidoreductase
LAGAVLAAWRACITTNRTQAKQENFMKILATIARYLLALVFIVFGLNGFLHFIPQPPPPSEMAGQYFKVMFASHYLVFVFGLQLIAGVLFLFRRTVPLALTIAGPLIVNILLFHALMDPGGIVPGLVVTALWFVVYWQFRAAFFGIFFTETQSDRSR